MFVRWSPAIGDAYSFHPFCSRFILSILENPLLVGAPWKTLDMCVMYAFTCLFVGAPSGVRIEHAGTLVATSDANCIEVLHTLVIGLRDETMSNFLILSSCRGRVQPQCCKPPNFAPTKIFWARRVVLQSFLWWCCDVSHVCAYYQCRNYVVVIERNNTQMCTRVWNLKTNTIQHMSTQTIKFT